MNQLVNPIPMSNWPPNSEMMQNQSEAVQVGLNPYNAHFMP